MSNTPTLPVYFDATMRSCFASCPRKYYNEFVLGRRPPGLSVDLLAGGCFALALEITYRELHVAQKPLDEALEKAHGAFAQMWGDFQIPEWKRTQKTFDRVWDAVEDYFKTYPPLTDTVQPYFASDGKPTLEYTFAIPLTPTWDGHPDDEAINAEREGFFPKHPNGGEFIYCGRFDMIGVKDGRPIVRDEKTSGAISKDWSERWNLRGQFIGYVWACQQCGLNLDEVVVRGIAIQKEEIKHAEATKVYSKVLVDRWHEQFRRDMWRVRRSWDESYWDYNLAETCTAYGLCPFMDSCASATPELWLNQLDIRHWNPLEKNPLKDQTT